MRLIDADELKECLRWCEVFRLTIKEICDNYIDTAPTVTIKEWKEEMPIYIKDAMLEALRPQGDWITDERGYVCSACGALHSDDYPFCHMCGADMRGE